MLRWIVHCLDAVAMRVIGLLGYGASEIEQIGEAPLPSAGIGAFFHNLF